MKVTKTILLLFISSMLYAEMPHPSEIFINAVGYIPWWLYILFALAIILPIITPKNEKQKYREDNPLGDFVDTIIDIKETIKEKGKKK